jgi:uncharacterized protein
MSLFVVLTGLVAVAAGAIASLAGFGISSLLTPTLGLQTGTKLAVAAVSIPHLVGTAVRFWRLRTHVDRRVLWSFGIMSAAGGLVGALLHTFVDSPLLSGILGGLLVFAGVSGLTGMADRMRFRGWTAWLAGGLSGVFGGLVGNQGGIRSAAMLGLDVPRDAFVATATAVALLVDAARMPVYLATQGAEIGALWPVLLAATAGVIVGTVVGERLLRRIPERIFRRVVAAIILVVGLFVLVQLAWPLSGDHP